MGLLDLLFVLVLNAVPLYGVYVLGWSAITVLLLYWFENLLTAVTTSIRIRLHRDWTRKRGHWRAKQLSSSFGRIDGSSTLLADYASAAFTFTIVHGVFVALFVAFGRHLHAGDPLWQLSPAQFAQGAACFALAAGVDLAGDLRTLRLRPFAWIKAYARRRLLRVVVLQLVIILGMAAVDASDGPVGVVCLLIIAKTLADVFGSRFERNVMPEKPPEWFGGAASAIGQLAGSTLDPMTMWQQARQAAIDAAHEDEQVMPA